VVFSAILRKSSSLRDESLAAIYLNLGKFDFSLPPRDRGLRDGLLFLRGSDV